jgi:transcription elongation GreA/GreB family factor
MHDGMVGDTIEPNELVEAQAEERSNGRGGVGLPAFAGDEPIEEGLLTAGAVDQFLAEVPIDLGQAGEIAAEQRFDGNGACFSLDQHARRNFSWFSFRHAFILRVLLRRRLEINVMREELEKLVAAGKIGRQQVEALLRLIECGYAVHRSWGFGKITTVDTVFSRLLVDFPARSGHSLDLSFAADTLRAIPPDHILARKASDLNGLRQMAALQHLDLVRLVLKSFGGAATAEQIQQVLVPEVIADDWKKWWEGVKRELKRDGHFVVPMKKSEPILFLETEVNVQKRLMAEFRAAKGLKARLAVVAEWLKHFNDMTDTESSIQEIETVLNNEIASHRQTQPALALEAIFIRDELRALSGRNAMDGEFNAGAIWMQNLDHGRVFDQMTATKHKQALQSFRETFPEKWDELLLGLLNRLSARLCGESVRLLIQEGKLGALKQTLARLISQHAASSELLLWLAKERSDSFADILGPEVFRSMLTAMERDQFNEKRSNRLGDYVMSDHELLVELIGSADLEVVKDLTRALQFSPAFDDMDKRSLLARIVKTFPSVQMLIAGDQTRQESNLIVSWSSLERRKREYDELVHKRIPANSKEIAIARSYGDLRENHEYKAAKEMHRLLLLRKAELENQLVRARGSDFSDVTTETVSIGTRVEVTDLTSEQRDSFTILGAWDSDPERGVISYLSPVAQSLLNRKPGDEVEFELDGTHRHYRLEKIEPLEPAKLEELAGSPAVASTTEPDHGQLADETATISTGVEPPVGPGESFPNSEGTVDALPRERPTEEMPSIVTESDRRD